MDTLDDVDIDDDVETELDVDTLEEKTNKQTNTEDHHFMFPRTALKRLLFWNSYSWILDAIITSIIIYYNFIATLTKWTHLMMLILTMMSTQNLKLRHYKESTVITFRHLNIPQKKNKRSRH